MSDLQADQSTNTATAPAAVPINKYKVTGQQQPASGGITDWSAQNWRAKGFGAGNRKEDTPQLNPKDPKAAPAVKDATMGAPSVPQANLDDIATKSSNNGGNGFYHDSTLGTVTQSSWGSGKYGSDGGSVDLYGGRAAAGAREQIGVRGAATADGKYGTASAKGDASLLAEAGADANYGIGSDGISASANAGARAGASVTGDADLKTKGLNIPGVSKPVDAGVGAHADGFAGAKVGVGGKVGISKDFIGAEGKAGAMAGAEGNVDIHGNLGPLKAKLGASGIAGIGAEASGGISLEDWKLHVGGHVGAALGLGGSVSFDGTLDLKQTAQLAMAGAKQLTPAQMAKNTSALMNGGANAVHSGWDGVKNFLDPEGTGHFSMHGLGVRADRMGQGISNAAHDATAWAGGKLNDAKDWAGDKLHQAGDAAKYAIAHPGETLNNAKDWAGKEIGAAGKALGSAKDWAGKELGAAKDFAGKELGAAKDWAGAKMSQAGDAAKFAIAHPGQALSNAKDWAGEKVSEAGQGIHNAASWAGKEAGAAKDAVVSGASSVYNGVKDNFKQAGSTLASGAKSAWGSLKGTGHDVAHFFGF
jgi:hypothetical protein